MDEYFCPNCGAVLNNQYGFDPNCGTWTCTECGTHLMDEDVYEGDTFEGVAWYCDVCGALLNRQTGFSDSYGSWECTNCGHRNCTTEADIINTGPQCPSCGSYLKSQSYYGGYEDDWTCEACGVRLHRDYSCDPYEEVKGDDGTKCPHCGASLKKQYSFSDWYTEYTCGECGTKLRRDYSSDPFEEVEEDDGLQCPHCGVSLNKQYSFSDSAYNHTCEDCGKKLHRTYSGDPFEVVDGPECPRCGTALQLQLCYSEFEDDWTCEECGARLHRDYSFEAYEEVDKEDEDNIWDGGENDIYDDNKGEESNYVSPVQPRASNEPYSKGKTSSSVSIDSTKAKAKSDRELRKIRIKAFLLKRKKISIEYNPQDLLRRPFESVFNSLRNNAFNNIECVPIKDIHVRSPYFVGEVEQIVINGSQYFESGDMIPYDAEIVITYHTKKEIPLPFSARHCRKKNCQTIGDQLQELGFTEIYEQPIRDLKTGWLVKDGSIEKVTIAGNDSFKKNEIHVFDDEIVIEYHTFKKKK